MAPKGSRPEGSVTFDATRNRWQARATVGYAPDGSQVRRKVVAPTRADVQRKLADLMRALERGEAPASSGLTVAAFLERWLTKALPGTVAPTTLHHYGDVVRLYVLPHLGRKRLASLTPSDVREMTQALTAAGKSPNTVRLARSILRRALRTAEQDGLVTRNVAAIADGVKVPQREGRTMTQAQAQAFLAHVHGHRLGAAWVTQLGLGLRRGELLGLSWADLKLDATPPTLTVNRALKRLSGVGLILSDTKTRQSRRTLPMPTAVATALSDHRRRQLAERLTAGPEWVAAPLGADLVFRTPFGTAADPDHWRQSTYAATIAAGIGRWSPHELRHSAASLLMAMGVPLKVISESLGHSSIRITSDVYAHLMADAQSTTAAAMDRAFGHRAP